MKSATGPLRGVKIVEFGAMGPGPFAGMMLSDMGADVLRIDRKTDGDPPMTLSDTRGRYSIALNLKDPAAIARCLDLCDKADIVFEGFRPGVMERLGLGPDVMRARNPKLIYGRMTGWGQSGPYAQSAGHDINYLAITGALHAIGTKDKPVPPLNLVGDYGGGSMFLVVGLLAALVEARKTGKGQVVDAAMCDGAAYLMSMTYGMLDAGMWEDRRSCNLVDGGAHFYDTYRCSDGQWISIASIEPQFYALLLEKAGASELAGYEQMDKKLWPELKEKLSAIFLTKSRDQWCEIMEQTDVCFAPVLSMTDAPGHPHNVARNAFMTVGDAIQPAPAPRFSDTPSAIRWAPTAACDDVDAAITDWIGDRT